MVEVPAWMFDRTACPDAELFAAQPFVSITALAALSALLDLALKDRTPSAVLLSGASRASHDQNRGETHEASPQTDEACGSCGSDRRFIDELW
jgi:hypothetical protein